MDDLKSSIKAHVDLIENLSVSLTNTVKDVARSTVLFAAEYSDEIVSTAKASVLKIEKSKELAKYCDHYWEYPEAVSFMLRDAKEAIDKIGQLGHPSRPRKKPST